MFEKYISTIYLQIKTRYKNYYQCRIIKCAIRASLMKSITTGDISKFQWKINTRAKSKRSRKTSFSRKQACFRSPSHSQKKSSSHAGFYEAFAVPRTVTIGTYRFTCTWRERLVKLNREKNVFSSLLPLCITIAPPSRNFNEGNLPRRMRPPVRLKSFWSGFRCIRTISVMCWEIFCVRGCTYTIACQLRIFVRSTRPNENHGSSLRLVEWRLWCMIWVCIWEVKDELQCFFFLSFLF